MRQLLLLGEDDKYNIYKAEKILFGLGFSQDDLEKAPKESFQVVIKLELIFKTSF